MMGAVLEEKLVCEGRVGIFWKGRCVVYFFTPLKINMEPQNEGLEDVFPFQMGDFQVPC